MGDPVRLLLTNAAAAGLIALLAWGASRVVRRPAVVHALWLLALLKLVSPPIAPLPLLPAWTAPPLFSAPRRPTVAVIPAPLGTDVRPRSESVSAEHATIGRLPSADTALASTRPVSHPVAPTPARPASTSPRFAWRAAAWALLASGALAIAALAAWRFRRFGRLLGCARPAPPALADRASALAAQLGLRRAPRVLVLPARIPPLLWPQRGGPLLLMPQGLLADLRADELDALLTHELAHVRRRDHWVRLVEIAATALFWWYPVTWWARRALRRAEERCCDEWVLRVLPRSAQAYANGLLKSLDLVAAAPVPAVASGLGPVEDLEARLKEILMTRPVPQLSVPLRVALAAAAILGLAVFPTQALPTLGVDDPAKAAPAETPAPAAKTAPVAPAKPAPAARPAAPAKPTPPTPLPAQPPIPPPAVVGGVPGGVVGGVPGGVAGGVPGGVEGGVPGVLAEVPPTPAPPVPLTPLPAIPPRPGSAPRGASTPPPALAPRAAATAPLAPLPAVAQPLKTRNPERRELEERRRAIEEQRRMLHRQELELARKQMELEAQAEQADMRAEAERLRAAGRSEEAAHLEKRIQLTSRRVELQGRQLELEAERAALEAKLEAEMRAHHDRLEAVGEVDGENASEDVRRELERAEAETRKAEQELEKKQQAIERGLQEKQEAIEREMAESDKEEQALDSEDQVRDMHEATEELARSLAEQIESLKQAAADTPSRKPDIDREIQRLKAALDALAGGTPKASPSKTPRP
ncbi:MAG TPA: M56 family metallopeptidase [Vicinamibacteria bacterium]|nr:M56 family metallopeptidase [Vicinamibacteria bacterium]